MKFLSPEEPKSLFEDGYQSRSRQKIDQSVDRVPVARHISYEIKDERVCY